MEVVHVPSYFNASEVSLSPVIFAFGQAGLGWGDSLYAADSNPIFDQINLWFSGLMSKPTLFVCRSCHHSEQRPSEQPADGMELCDRIQTLHQTWPRQSELEVRGVDCLWTCDHPCSIALTAGNKPTYVLAKVLVKDDNHGEIAEAVLQLSERYLDSKSGTIPWKQFPEVLKTEFIAFVPPANFSDSDEAY